MINRFFFCTEGLKRYYEKNNKLPDKIAVYRDGVSEGQIQHVYETEIKEMEKALETVRRDLQESKTIGWAFTIVTKRVRARFFANRPGEGIVNPGPGTIVDRDVTRRQRYDFYLISQSVRRGTVSPTMYNIIGDSTGWKAIHHQQLAYKLCHLYFNWAVSQESYVFGRIEIHIPLRSRVQSQFQHHVNMLENWLI